MPGVEKGGTTALYNFLLKHPQILCLIIALPSPREIPKTFCQILFLNDKTEEQSGNVLLRGTPKHHYCPMGTSQSMYEILNFPTKD